MKKIRIVCAIALIIMLSLCACNKEKAVSSIQLPESSQHAESKEDDAYMKQNNREEETVQIETTQKEENNEVYHLAYSTILLPDQSGCETAQCLFTDRIIVAEQTEEGAKLFAESLDGETTELPIPSEAEYVYAVCENYTGFSVLYGSYPAAYRDYNGDVVINESPEGRVFIANYNEKMEIESQIQLGSLYVGNNDRFMQMLKEENGFYLVSAELLTYVGNDGIEVAREEISMADGWRFAAIQLRSGKLYALAAERVSGKGDELWEYDVATLEQTNTYKFSDEKIKGMGASNDSRLLLNSNSGIMAFDPQTYQKEQLVLWDEMGLSVEGEQIQLMENGYIFYTQNQKSIDTVQWVEGEQIGRKILTMAVTTPDIDTENVKLLVHEFNTSQEEYQVNFATYSEMQSNDVQSNDVLRTEIMAGKGPDLFYFCSTGDSAEMPIKPISACVDLIPLMEGEISQEDIVPNLYNLTLENGKLYQLPLTFIIDTVIAPKTLISAPGVTVEELESVRKKAGSDWVTFESWNSAQNLFLLSAPFYIGKYVDKENGECNFQTQEFYDYLSWCKMWGGDGSIAPEEEHAILRYKRINNLEYLAGLSDRTLKWFGTYGYTYAGIPNETSSGSTYCLTSSVGISSQCNDIDGAREFVKFCFEYAGEHSTTIPANYEKLKERMNLYIAGNETDWRGESVKTSKEDAEQFYDLLDSITELRATDDTVIQIMQEEAAPYFAGQSSAEQVAENIQARVNLYLLEQG